MTAVLEPVYFTEDFIPLCITESFAVFRCRIPVVPGGDGADVLPPAERTARCGHATYVLVGAAPTCLHHLGMVFRIGRVGNAPRSDLLRCEP